MEAARLDRLPASTHRGRPDEFRGFPCAVAVSPRRAAEGVARHHGESPDRHRPRGGLRRIRPSRPIPPARAILLLAFPIPFLLFIANTAPASRYLNPVVPFLALFAAWSLSNLAARIRGTSPALFWIAVALAAAPGFQASLRSDAFLRRDDTRTLAERYIEANLQHGSTILTQPYSSALTPSREGLTEDLGSPGDASIKFQLQLALDPYPSPAYRLIYLGRGGLDADKIYVDPALLGGSDGLEPLRRLGVTYILLKRYNRPDPETLPFLAALSREGRRIAVFSPYRPGISEAEEARFDPFLHNTDARIVDALERPGPPLEIWQLNAPGT